MARLPLRDLLVETLVVHGDLAHLGAQPVTLFVTHIASAVLQSRCARLQEHLPLTAAAGASILRATNKNVLAPQHPQNGLLLAHRRLSASSGRSRSTAICEVSATPAPSRSTCFCSVIKHLNNPLVSGLNQCLKNSRAGEAQLGALCSDGSADRSVPPDAGLLRHPCLSIVLVKSGRSIFFLVFVVLFL